MRSASQHMNWWALIPAYVILGGAALLVLGGAQEMAQNNAHPIAVALALAGSAGLVGVLALLTWMNWRAARFRASRWGRYDQTGNKGGFGKGFLYGLLGVFMTHIALFLCMTLPATPEALRVIASIALLPFSVLYTVVPLFTGWMMRFIVATRI